MPGLGRAGPRPATAGRPVVRRNSAGRHAGRGGRWTAGRTRPPPGLRRRHATAADRRHACTPGRWPRRVMVPAGTVPPMDGTISCRRWLAGMVLPIGSTCRPACDRRPAGTVPPIGGTAWCRLLAARYTEARLGGGAAGPCGALQRTPGGVLVSGRPGASCFPALLWQSRAASGPAMAGPDCFREREAGRGDGAGELGLLGRRRGTAGTEGRLVREDGWRRGTVGTGE